MAGKKAKIAVARPKRPQYQPTYIRQWREDRRLTQEQLAERVGTYLSDHGLADGYTHATIGRLERGLVRYTQPIMEAIAWALNTDVASLIMRDPSQPGIWTLWDQAKESDRVKIIAIAETILGKTGTDN